MLNNERVRVIRLMGDGDDRLLALLPKSAPEPSARDDKSVEPMTFPNVPYCDHRRKDGHRYAGVKRQREPGADRAHSRNERDR